MDAGSFRLLVKPADLAAQARAVVDSLRPQMEEAGLRWELLLPEKPLTAPFDARRIEQVLLNLVSNAIKFTTTGGCVRVEVRPEGEHLRCAVSDTGIGIAPEDVPRLFQRFSQLAGGVRKEGGTGLGLSIAKALVEAHGGAIGVESQPGVGSTFWFTLPAGVEAEASNAPTSSLPG
jgi:signal transduction histidine kinase